jgi:hypothetical protein
MLSGQHPYDVMDWDDRFNLDNNVSFLSWVRKYNEARESRLTDWVSHISSRLPALHVGYTQTQG